MIVASSNRVSKGIHIMARSRTTWSNGCLLADAGVGPDAKSPVPSFLRHVFAEAEAAWTRAAPSAWAHPVSAVSDFANHRAGVCRDLQRFR